MNTKKQQAMKLTIALLLVLGAAEVGAKPLGEGTHILAMVVRTFDRASIVESGEQGMLGRLQAEGIADADISDGSVAQGIVYCCGGKISQETAIAFYVPPEYRLQEGDVVEVNLGRIVTKKEFKRGDRGTINRVVSVRESFTEETGVCRWDPPNETLWMRVLYCEWMLGEGWERRGGLSPGWYLEPGSAETVTD